MRATTLLILERACVGPNVETRAPFPAVATSCLLERFDATCHRSSPATAGRMPRAKYQYCTRRKSCKKTTLYHTALRQLYAFRLVSPRTGRDLLLPYRCLLASVLQPLAREKRAWSQNHWRLSPEPPELAAFYVESVRGSKSFSAEISAADESATRGVFLQGRLPLVLAP